MQLCNLTLRLGGSLLHTVPVRDATPGEILVLKRIHGDDAVTDVRPTKVDKNRRHEIEWERLSHKYDRGSAFSAQPGEERRSLMETLFPGAVKKLPTTLQEIGLGHLLSPAARKAAAEADRQIVPGPEDKSEPTVISPAAPLDDNDGAPVDDGDNDADDGVPAEAAA